VEEARAAVNTIWRRTQTDRHIPVAPGVIGVSSYRDLNAKGEIKLLFSGILVACVLVLLIACLNVANLSFARAARRTHELAIRSALGASRNHIIWVLLKENLLISFCAAIIGIVLSNYGLSFFASAIERESQLTGGAIPWFHLGIDGWVLLFVAVLVVATALAAGMFPAWRASQIEVEPVLRDGARTTSRGFTRFRHLLVNVQIAGSIVLVVASALMGSVALQFQNRLQYDPAQLLTGRVSIDRESAGPQTTDHDIAAARTLERIQNGLEKIPGADAVAWTSAEHIERAAPATVELEGASGGRTIDNRATQWQVIAGSYFGLFSTNALDGRIFDGRDNASSTRVAVINTTFAQRCWPGVSAIGKRFRLSGGPHSSDWLQVAGVVPDVGSLRPAQQQLGPMVYLPISQNPVSAMSFLVKTGSDPRALIPTVRQAIAIVDPQLPVFELFTGSDIQELESIGFRLPTILIALCGLSALCLATIGVYGVLALSAKERTHEIGIRIALGADPANIMRMLVWEYGRSVALAAVGGIILSFIAARFLASLFGVFRGELIIVSTVCILMSIVAFAAVLIPSRAAARTSPLEALRVD
jgi:putative ABC transport system permease protein